MRVRRTIPGVGRTTPGKPLVWAAKELPFTCVTAVLVGVASMKPLSGWSGPADSLQPKPAQKCSRKARRIRRTTPRVRRTTPGVHRTTLVVRRTTPRVHRTSSGVRRTTLRVRRTIPGVGRTTPGGPLVWAVKELPCTCVTEFLRADRGCQHETFIGLVRACRFPQVIGCVLRSPVAQDYAMHAMNVDNTIPLMLIIKSVAGRPASDIALL